MADSAVSKVGGLPSGGSSGQSLRKAGSASYNTEWRDDKVVLQYTIQTLTATDRFTLLEYVPVDFDIETIYYKCSGGSATLNIYKNNITVPGLFNLSVGTTQSNSSPTSGNESVSVGDILEMQLATTNVDMFSLTVVGRET